MTIYHKHHIIPRHMGGTDDPSNLIKLTVKEHAEEHRKLYEQYGHEEDRIAWLALSNQITLDEAKYESIKLGAKKGGKTIFDKKIGVFHPDFDKGKGGRKSGKINGKVAGEKSYKNKTGIFSSDIVPGSHTIDRIWINNGIKNKSIYPKDFDEYYKNGWIKGMKRRGASLTEGTPKTSE